MKVPKAAVPVAAIKLEKSNLRSVSCTRKIHSPLATLQKPARTGTPATASSPMSKAKPTFETTLI